MRDRSTPVKDQSPSFAPEGTNVLFDVWFLSRATTAVLDAALEPSGLTADEFGIYSVLTSADSMTPTDLSRWMSAPLTTVSSYVKRFERRGHVTRIRNPNDGRSWVLTLTPEGHRAHQAAGELFVPVLERVVTALGQHEPGVREALGALRRALHS